jgi:D-3-phosphoglycerate dehydrogenase / 2-oxoglutarate reductase
VSYGAGYDTIDVEALTAAGIGLVNQAGGNAQAVAEHALGMMLALSKRFVETDRYMRRQNGISRNAFMGHDIIGKTVGIVGLGNVGTRTAELCRGLFRMRVLAYDPYLTSAQIAAHGAEKVELDQLMRESDFVSVHCPYNEETANMIGAPQYAVMKPDAYFITTARGGIHDEAALVEILKAKKIAGAGLDVWVDEPPPHDHPLMQFDTVIVTPHTAGVTHEARVNMGQIAADQMLLALDGGRAPRIQNPEVWPAYVERFRKEFGVTPA